jgi:intracellular sulfur oxidation DsrE/DsrF family protein
MSDSNSTPVARRSFLARLGAGISMAGASLVAGVPVAAAQTSASASGRFQPARHTQDDWMDQLPGKHRFVIDTTTASGFGAGLLYANNFFVANDTGYGLKDPDIAVIIVARHFATPFAYKDAMWAKYGVGLTGVTSLNDPKTKQPPTINVYNAAGNDSLASMGTTVDTLIKRGVHFAVCQMATRFFSGMLATASGGNADTIYNDLAANLVPNAHLASAGIVAVNRAQERGYTAATAI